jgi:sulfate adenylyltransferase subunit 2
MRVFPLSNWTEMDVWEYIKKEKLEVPKHLFQPRARMFPARRPVAAGAAAAHGRDQARSLRRRASEAERAGQETRRPRPHHRRHDQHRHDRIARRHVDDIIAEVAAARVTERGTRADDKASEAAMEDRKKAGYF